ncbi:RNA polymerase sigma factor [Mesobacillus subterraneus]|uniref:Sigma-70 family RNA polymerase sigma factor n=1 Tax=Mesobacillus subterraneus TaxID=285983 RepID=A0A427TVD4_9BACI|nr:RNA polymerase sigma factor [Mesobacillus subterraneus]RSD28433.1 sigma-70 family RNA polymerase sigma factor [Mesobacillus subterraneus]
MDVVRLVKKAKRGSKDALMELILAKKDEMYRLAYAYMGNQHDAMDALEEMIVRLYENIGQLKKEESFYSWSKTILVNICKTTLRKQKKQVLVDEWHSSHEEERIHQDAGQHLEVQEMLSILNETQKEAIQLKYILDLDYQTIAKMTNVPLGTVKSRVFQGLKKLKDHFGGEGR